MKRKPAMVQAAGQAAKGAPWVTGAMAAAIGASVVLALLPPLALESIVNGLAGGQGVPLSGALGYFALLAAAGLAEAAQNVTITIYGQKVTHWLRRAMCAKLDRLPAAYYAAQEPGAIASRLVSDVDAVDALFTNGILSMVADGCKVLSILAVIVWKSRGLGVLMLAVTPFLFWLTRRFQKRMLSAQMEHREAVARVNHCVPETIQNIRTIHTYGRQRYMEERYDRAIQQSYRAMERSNWYDALYSPIVVFTSACVVAVMMALAASGGAMRQWFGMEVGTAVAIIAYVSKVFEPLESIGMEIQNIQSAWAGIRRIDEFLAQPERPASRQDLTLEVLRRAPAAIRFQNVDFGYGEEPVLQGLSFTVEPGETVTLVGRTGAGKSTAFRLLLGLYEPQGGQVTVCGQPAGAIPDRVKRGLFGYVEQSPRLVDGTVADQIALFDPAIGRQQVRQAAEQVGLHAAIEALEQGYDTPAREDLFSQGQLQLLSIARAIAADPPILLLDEMTANLDGQTEAAVLAALEQAAAHRTVLSLSHRLYQGLGGRQIPIGGDCR